jgi:hypothetical protein
MDTATDVMRIRRSSRIEQGGPAGLADRRGAEGVNLVLYFNQIVQADERLAVASSVGDLLIASICPLAGS